MECILPGQTSPYVSDRLLYFADLQLDANTNKMVLQDVVYENGGITTDTGCDNRNTCRVYDIDVAICS